MSVPENKVEETKKEPESIDYEALARSEGWRPKEELGSSFNPKLYCDAEEYIKRKPFIDERKSYRSEIRELKKTIESVVSFTEKNAQLAAKRAISELKAERKEAIKLGDSDKVEALDENIKEHEKAVDVPPKDKVAPEIIEWTKSNDWFNKEMELQDFAVAYCASYTKAHPEDGMDKALEKTSQATRRAFPDSPYFKEKTAKREDPAQVETHKGESSKDGKGKKYSIDRLNAEQKLTYQAYVKPRSGKPTMTHDQYFQKLEEINALEA